MDTAFLHKLMDQNILVIGFIIKKMDSERKNGLMVLNMKATIKKTISRVTENLNKLMGKYIMDSGSIIKWKGLELSHARMEESMKVNI